MQLRYNCATTLMCIYFALLSHSRIFMSSTTPALKRHNHRVHPCQAEKKDELLKLLIEKNAQLNILVVTSGDKEKIQNAQNSKNVTILTDEELLDAKELKAELVISYDLPDKAIKYMARIAHSSTYALILLDPSEERLLYSIETLIGRTIMQESIEGFGPKVALKEESVKKEYKQKRDDKPRSKKPFNKDKKSSNKFLGKDEHGKAKFSGKSGERNHRYDGKPKESTPKLTGKKINIKSLKKSKDKE